MKAGQKKDCINQEELYEAINNEEIQKNRNFYGPVSSSFIPATVIILKFDVFLETNESVESITRKTLIPT